MGNLASKGRSMIPSGREIQEKVFLRRYPDPLTPEQIEAMNRIVERDQARMKELVSMEELNSKDQTMDNFLGQMHGAIKDRTVVVSGKLEPKSQSKDGTATTSGSSQDLAAASAVARLPPGGRRRLGGAAPAEPGRVQSYVLREVLEARNAETIDQPLDLTRYTQMYGVSAEKLMLVMKYACLPRVGKVNTFGHQYAFARAPSWWMPNSGGKYKSDEVPFYFQRKGDKQQQPAGKAQGPSQPLLTPDNVPIKRQQ